jgi:hypothetical protein
MIISAAKARELVAARGKADLVELDLRIKAAARQGLSTVCIWYDMSDYELAVVRSNGYTVDVYSDRTLIKW